MLFSVMINDVNFQADLLISNHVPLGSKIFNLGSLPTKIRMQSSRASVYIRMAKNASPDAKMQWGNRSSFVIM